ncbi:preprotein translocase subunit YajC [Sanguibacter suaedae]|uniref:Preprotein translocase subunit YajC n=1 Tax=Sanguibacter suaedae TaxID=2795737 RepID=A0A934M7E5_9MICO|nr:preprotein translocase subunit YajC [Sanguibacter suaedae]MBI9115317.1 preprotein translocase subunit YajC [Sanguibacter suaedae]
MEILLIGAFAVGAMFLMTNGSRKKQREAMTFRDNLEVGHEVMTGSGFFGTVVAVDDDVITLESTPGNRSRWLRAAIAKQVEPTQAATAGETGEATSATSEDAAFAIPDDISGLIKKPTTDDPEKK